MVAQLCYLLLTLIGSMPAQLGHWSYADVTQNSYDAPDNAEKIMGLNKWVRRALTVAMFAGLVAVAETALWVAKM
ncbi:MAG: hypothetical protein PGN26_08085 [Xylophilus ampelinus]